MERRMFSVGSVAALAVTQRALSQALHAAIPPLARGDLESTVAHLSNQFLSQFDQASHTTHPLRAMCVIADWLGRQLAIAKPHLA